MFTQRGFSGHAVSQLVAPCSSGHLVGVEPLAGQGPAMAAASGCSVEAVLRP